MNGSEPFRVIRSAKERAVESQTRFVTTTTTTKVRGNIKEMVVRLVLYGFETAEN